MIYVICMKNGEKYKTELEIQIDELIEKLLPRSNESKILICNILDSKGKSVVIVGREVSNIEFFVKQRPNSWD